MHGLAERLGVGSWNWRTGTGHVAPVKGDYARAEALGVDVRCLLIETFGGLSPAVCDVLRQIAEQRQNRLRSDEYDYATWSTRSWRAFAVQQAAGGGDAARGGDGDCARDGPDHGLRHAGRPERRTRVRGDVRSPRS